MKLINGSRIFNVILLLLAVSFPVFAGEGALVLENISMSDDAAKTKTSQQIQEKLTEELKRQNLEYYDSSMVADTIKSQGITPDKYSTADAALALGKSADVPVVLSVDLSEKDGLMEIAITAWDVKGGKEIGKETSVSKTEVTRYIMINSVIRQIVNKLTGDYALDIPKEQPKVRKITFLANQEGMEVYLSDGEYLGKIVHSVLNISNREYEIGTKLLVEKKLKGYRSAEQFVYLDKEKSAVALSDLKKAQTLAFEMNWTYPQLMGAGTGIRYYPIPDWLFISFDSYFYVQKDFSVPDGLGITHSDMRLLSGVYIGFGPEKRFRVNVSLGGGVIITYPLEKSGFYFDTYVSPLNVAMELNFDNWSFYLRPELKFDLGIGNSSLQQGGILVSEYKVPFITVGVLRKW